MGSDCCDLRSGREALIRFIRSYPRAKILTERTCRDHKHNVRMKGTTMLVRGFTGVFAFIVIFATSAAAEEPCPNGAIFATPDGKYEFIILREGYVRVPWSGDKPIPGRAVEMIVPTGEIGYIYGPMNSYFFITDQKTLEKYGVQWQPDSAYDSGFYTIRTDDGYGVRFELIGKKCRE